MPEQKAEAVRINSEARLTALKVTFFTLAGLTLLTYFPAGRLPAHLLAERVRDEAASPASREREEQPVSPSL